ncbi:MAG TPA: glycosyltransferase family 8 protein [Candidatus Saccharimonadales bacterium]
METFSVQEANGVMTASTINIAMCFDDGYVFPSKIALYSLFRNNPHHEIHVYVIHSELSSECQRELKELTDFFENKKLIFKKISDKKIRDKFSETLVIDYISIATYYRYVLADELPDIEKILYIDGDILFNADIMPIWQTSLGDNLFAAVQDNWVMNEQKEHLRDIGFNDATDKYFNAGFLLMNLKQIRKHGITKHLFDITQGDEYKGRLTLQDQDALNIVCKGKIKKLPQKYQYMSYDFYRDSHSFNDVIAAHYTGPTKPWKHREASSRSDIYFLQIYNDYMDGLERLIDGRDEFEWRDMYENSVKQRHVILDLERELAVAKSTKRSVYNILVNMKTKISKK